MTSAVRWASLSFNPCFLRLLCNPVVPWVHEGCWWYHVSILVFLDFFATQASIQTTGIIGTGCFNPCFLRLLCNRKKAGRARASRKGFNPCFRRLSCNSNTGGKGTLRADRVSILVFVDSLATRRLRNAGSVRTPRVSILVFVDSLATEIYEVIRQLLMEFQSLFS